MNITQAFSAGGALSQYFHPETGEYVLLQFSGWKQRNAETGRTQGEPASWRQHPDVGKAFDQLPAATQDFIRWMSQWQLVMYAALSTEELNNLRECSRTSTAVPETLRDKVNRLHHKAWMAARDTFELLGLGTVKERNEHRSHHLLTPDEIAADDKQVAAYAGILAAMPDEQFEELRARCRS